MTAKYDEMTFGFILLQFTNHLKELLSSLFRCLAYKLLYSFHEKTTFLLLHDAVFLIDESQHDKRQFKS